MSTQTCMFANEYAYTFIQIKDTYINPLPCPGWSSSSRGREAQTRVGSNKWTAQPSTASQRWATRCCCASSQTGLYTVWSCICASTFVYVSVYLFVNLSVDYVEARVRTYPTLFACRCISSRKGSVDCVYGHHCNLGTFWVQESSSSWVCICIVCVRCLVL